MDDSTSAIIVYNVDFDELNTIIENKNLVNLHIIDSNGLEDRKISEIINNITVRINKKVKAFSDNNSFIIFHNADGKTINEVIKSIKIKGSSCVFATTTETNIKWTLKDLLAELLQEHKRYGK
ncbi:MAG: DUF3783 domain-containing protein [Petrotogales bacterium]